MADDITRLEQTPTNQTPLDILNLYKQNLQPDSGALLALRHLVRLRYLEAYVAVGEEDIVSGNPDEIWETDLPKDRAEIKRLKEIIKQNSDNQDYQTGIEKAKEQLNTYEADYIEQRWGKTKAKQIGQVHTTFHAYSDAEQNLFGKTP